MSTQDKHTTEELLPCPFCSGAATLHANGIARFVFHVQCDRCGVSAPKSTFDDSAIKNWNTRACAAAQQEKPHTGTVADFDDAHLLRRAILNARGPGRGKQPRWVAVMHAFNLGSTYASQLCKRFEINPDEMVKP